MSRLNRPLVIFIILIVVVIGWLAFSQDQKSLAITCSDSTATQVMEMSDESFSPKDLDIKKCTKVIFKNVGSNPRWPASNLHPTHEIYPAFDPQEGIPAGSEWSFVFDQVGSWRYHDHLSPYIRGTIIVRE